MAGTTTLPGVDRHGDKYRVRVLFPAPFGRVAALGDTPEEAYAAGIELRRRRKAGLPPSEAHGDMTLREAAEQLLVRKATAVSRKTKRRLTPNGFKHWDVATRPWREGPHADTPLSLLSRRRVEDDLLALAVTQPTTARNHLEGLKATLRYAGDRGARFDLALLGIEPVVVEPRTRQALSVEELELLASCAPDYAQRLLLVMGTTGLRSEEAFTLTDDRVDLDAGVVEVPAELNKEHRDKVVPLDPQELLLLREQLGGLQVVNPASGTAHLPPRASGTSLVFPKAGGTQWSTRRSHFHKLVWTKACARAAEAWREERELADDAPTPYDDLKPHDLRSTAATLMRDAGMSKDDAAARLGHADSRLLDAVYDQGDRAARVARGLQLVAPEGLRAAAARGRSTVPTRQPAASGKAT